MIGTEEIAQLVPHSGCMRLIDEVLEWDLLRIRCRTRSHLSRDNPLRSPEGLEALHLLEYGAQAMAIHGGLCSRVAGRIPGAGMLASARDVRLEIARLDDLPGPLDLHANQLLATAEGWLYEFSAHCAERRLATGRIIVMLGKGAP